MLSALISHVIFLRLSTVYPAYASYTAVRTKNIKEYAKWTSTRLLTLRTADIKLNFVILLV